jgi:outer membrane receptor protein involved in Fe transport
VTFVQARQNYILVPPTATTAAITTLNDLTGLSRTTYNATLYYDDSVFEARVSAAFRSKFLVSVGPTSGLSANDSQIQASSFNLDASTSYKVDENFSIDLQALNLTNQGLYQYNDTVGKRQLLFYQTGREFFAGIRYNYYPTTLSRVANAGEPILGVRLFGVRIPHSALMHGAHSASIFPGVWRILLFVKP